MEARNKLRTFLFSKRLDAPLRRRASGEGLPSAGRARRSVRLQEPVVEGKEERGRAEKPKPGQRVENW